MAQNQLGANSRKPRDLESLGPSSTEGPQLFESAPNLIILTASRAIDCRFAGGLFFIDTSFQVSIY